MKTLYLVRHAKSDWSEPGQGDEDRELLPKGIERTELIIHFLKRKGIQPGLILSSHAVRAHDTACLIAKGLDYPVRNIKLSRQLYQSDETALIKIISSQSDAIDSLMLVGHNPEFTHLSNHFLNKKIDWLPTTGVVCLQFDTDTWANIGNAPLRDEFVIFPKMLK